MQCVVCSSAMSLHMCRYTPVVKSEINGLQALFTLWCSTHGSVTDAIGHQSRLCVHIACDGAAVAPATSAAAAAAAAAVAAAVAAAAAVAQLCISLPPRTLRRQLSAQTISSCLCICKHRCCCSCSSSKWLQNKCCLVGARTGPQLDVVEVINRRLRLQTRQRQRKEGCDPFFHQLSFLFLVARETLMTRSR